jgi:hypothetical protein
MKLSGYILTPERLAHPYRIGMIMKMMNYDHTGVKTIKVYIKSMVVFLLYSNSTNILPSNKCHKYNFTVQM